MGTLYGAYDRQLDRTVALKIATQERAGQLKSEAQNAARVQHPGVVQVFGTGRDGDRFFVAMERLTGQDLHQRLSSHGPLPIEEVLDLGAQCARALAAVHEAGVIHRDIKPENIFLADDERGAARAKLVDFGLAQTYEEAEQSDKTDPRPFAGSLQYAPPEAIGLSIPGIVPASNFQAGVLRDVYSLGAVLFEALTGEPPSLLRIASETAQENSRLEDWRPDASPRLAAIIERALARNPTVRYSGARELAEDLEREGMPRRGGAESRATRRPRLPRWRKGVLVAGLGLSVAGIGFVFLGGESGEPSEASTGSTEKAFQSKGIHAAPTEGPVPAESPASPATPRSDQPSGGAHTETVHVHFVKSDGHPIRVAYVRPAEGTPGASLCPRSSDCRIPASYVGQPLRVAVLPRGKVEQFVLEPGPEQRVQVTPPDAALTARRDAVHLVSRP